MTKYPITKIPAWERMLWYRLNEFSAVLYFRLIFLPARLNPGVYLCQLTEWVMADWDETK